MKRLHRVSKPNSNESAPVATSAKPPIGKQPAKHPSGLDPAWMDRMLTSAKRMHEDDDYRKTIAQKLS